MFADRSQNQLCCVALCLGKCVRKADSFVCLGSAGFLLAGAMETSGVSHTSASVALLCVIPPRATFLPLHTLLILSTLSSAGVDFLILHFTATCTHSSISLILHHLLCCFFLSFYVVSLTVFLSCTLQSIKCFSWNVILTIFSCLLYTNLRFHNRTCSETWAEDGCFYNYTERSFTC